MSAIAVQEQTFTIAEVADTTGVSAHTLRYYERIGLLDVRRQASGHRTFTENDVGRVVFIGSPAGHGHADPGDPALLHPGGRGPGNRRRALVAAAGAPRAGPYTAPRAGSGA
jgi:hypothetical protein